MGQKVSPHGLRVGIIKDWSSKWFANKENFSDILVQDNEIRKFLKKKLYEAGISKIVIERPKETEINIDLLVEKPGLVIGQGGNGINDIKEQVKKLTKKDVEIAIYETENASTDPQLVAEKIAQDLERRVPFRRAMKMAFKNVLDNGVLGVKMVVSGRLNGTEIARAEKYNEGIVPLHTLRAKIEYGFAEADTTYGKLGVKVWINKGEQLDSGLLPEISEETKDAKESGGKRKSSKSGGSKFSNRKSADRRGYQRGETFKMKNPRIKPKTTEDAPKVKEAVKNDAEKTEGEVTNEANTNEKAVTQNATAPKQATNNEAINEAPQKNEAPVTEAPKDEAPKADEVKEAPAETEAPKAEEVKAAPAETEAPKEETPKAEVKASEEPAKASDDEKKDDEPKA